MMTPKFLLDNISTIRVNDNTQFKIQRPYYTFTQYSVIEDILNKCPNGEINRGIVTDFLNVESMFMVFCGNDLGRDLNRRTYWK